MANATSDYKLGQLDDFKEATLIRLDRMEFKIDSLIAWKFKVSGVSATIGAITGFIVNKLL